MASINKTNKSAASLAKRHSHLAFQAIWLCFLFFWLSLAFLSGCNQFSCGYMPSTPVTNSDWEHAWTVQVVDLYGPWRRFEICIFPAGEDECVTIF